MCASHMDYKPVLYEHFYGVPYASFLCNAGLAEALAGQITVTPIT